MTKSFDTQENDYFNFPFAPLRLCVKKIYKYAVSVIVLLTLASCRQNVSEKNVQDLSGKPNVIVIFSDDMNYTGPSCYGSKWGIKTPFIDQLAEEGVRFTNAYCSAPTCGPSRAGLVTGRYQTSFGHEFNSAREEGIGLPLAEKTFGNRMKELGYSTGIVGKWHLGGDENCGEIYHPLNRGFDYFFGFYGSMVHFFRSSHIFRGREQVKDSRYLTDIIAEESCNFIDRNRENPFFLYVAFNAVHTPLEAAEQDLAFIDSLPHFEEFLIQSNTIQDNPAAIEKAKLRAAMLRGLDKAVGQITAKLAELGLDENTLVVFANDNGDYNNNGIYSGGKGSCREGGIRIPFILKWPAKLRGGQIFNGMTTTLDVLPTIVSAAGGKILPEWNIHGTNLIPHITGIAGQEPHDWLFWRMGGTKAARNGQWKLLFNGKSGYGGFGVPEDEARWLLFNLEADPAEERDLSAVFPEVFSKMLAEYNRWETQQMEPRWSFGASGQMGQW
jgi:arylsulfatase A-like enzyme